MEEKKPDLVKRIKELYENNMPIFSKIGKLNKKELYFFLLELCTEEDLSNNLKSLLKEGSYVKEYTDDEISEITISYYDDVLKITWIDIHWSDPYNINKKVLHEYSKYYDYDATIKVAKQRAGIEAVNNLFNSEEKEI